jgi:hypothetical protein
VILGIPAPAAPAGGAQRAPPGRDVTWAGSARDCLGIYGGSGGGAGGGRRRRLP